MYFPSTLIPYWQQGQNNPSKSERRVFLKEKIFYALVIHRWKSVKFRNSEDIPLMLDYFRYVCFTLLFTVPVKVLLISIDLLRTRKIWEILSSQWSSTTAHCRHWYCSIVLRILHSTCVMSSNDSDDTRANGATNDEPQQQQQQQQNNSNRTSYIHLLAGG